MSKHFQRGMLLNPFRFGPAPPPGADPYFSMVKLLLSGEGVAGATTGFDKSSFARVPSIGGSVALSNTYSKFGTTSLEINGVSGYLNYGYLSDVAFADGTGDFTIDYWARPAALGSIAVVGQRMPVTGDGWSCFGSGPGTVYLQGKTGYVETPSGVIAAGVFSFMEFSRQGSTYRAFVDGVLKATNSTMSLGSPTSTPFLVGVSNVDLAYPFSGHINDLRITAGVARHTASYTPPTGPAPLF